jgi:anti-sigma factor RsiW
MDVSCEDVWKEISNYLENDLDPSLRAALEAHFARCRHCSAVLEGTRNIIGVYGDERVFELPAGFARGLQRKLSPQIVGQRGSALAWALSLAFVGMIVLALLVGHVRQVGQPRLLSRHSQPALRVPPGMVAVAANSKTFHVPSCPYLHGSWKLVPAEVAIREGYNPCVRCEHELQERAAGGSSPNLEAKDAGGE